MTGATLLVAIAAILLVAGAFRTGRGQPLSPNWVAWCAAAAGAVAIVLWLAAILMD